MRNPLASESFAPVILGLAVLIVGPAVLTDPMIAALTATPLRQAVCVFVVSIVIGVVSFWAVPRVSLRATSTAEGTQGGES